MKSLLKLSATAAWLAGSAFAVPSVYPTGTTIYDPAKAYNTYVLFAGADDHTHLIDMDGNEVHRWTEKGLPSYAIDPALAGGQKGHILAQTSQAKGDSTDRVPGVAAIFGDRTIGELDWNDKKVWEYGTQTPGGALHQHHDLRRLPNGNTLILINTAKSLPGFKAPKLLDDTIEEVTPDGKLVWSWAFGDHIDELGFTPEELQRIKDSGNPDYLHINDMVPLGPNHWFDAGDQRFDPDNILVDSRNTNFLAIISRKTGKIVWRIGPDYPSQVKNFGWVKQTLPRPVDQLSGQHDSNLIPKGFPGAGDILVFDNQGPAGYPDVPLNTQLGSRILEINPATKQIVWEYTALNSGLPSWTFYSSFISSARRLPNGNTLIDEGISGRFFQVTPKGEVVWEYISPFRGQYLQPGITSNWVYRAQPVPYNWVPDGTPHAEKAVPRN